MLANAKKNHRIILVRERLHHEFSLSYPHSKRKLMVKYSGTYVDTEVWHSYFFSKNPWSNLWLFAYQKTHARIYSQGKYKYTYFYVTATLRIIKTKGFEHQMFTRWQFKMTPTFLLVDIARCFFPRHGTRRLSM